MMVMLMLTVLGGTMSEEVEEWSSEFNAITLPILSSPSLLSSLFISFALLYVSACNPLHGYSG